MASSISSGSGQASPARRARCRQSMTVVAPIDRLAAILRLDMPAAVSRSTSRTLRMGNLAPGIGPFPPCGKRADLIRIRGSPNGPLHTPSPQFTTPARDRSERVLGISRNDCSGSIGTGCSGSIGIAARDHSVRPILYGPRTGSSPEVFTEGVVAVALAKAIWLWTWVGLLCFDPITFFVEVR